LLIARERTSTSSIFRAACSSFSFTLDNASPNFPNSVFTPASKFQTSLDRFWIAKQGDEVVGMSLVSFPPERGVPSTEFTGTSPQHRGRGIGRALKYETVAQAIELGATRIRTDNDSANAPILHLNEEMGYQPIKAYIELHREIG